MKQLTFIEKFFGNQWNSWINKLKFFIMPLLLIWVAICLWRVTELKRAQEPLNRLRDGHWLAVLEETLKDDMHKSADANALIVYLVWGIDKLDRNGLDRWDSTDIGKNVYDTSFDVSPIDHQQRIVDICDDLKASSYVLNEQVE